MITGQLTQLRPFEAADQPFLADLSRDPVIRRNVVGWDWPLSTHAQESWFNNANRDHTTQRWIITDLQGGRLGMTGLWEIDWRNRNAVTGLKLGGPRPQRGRGYGTDAIRSLMAFAFTDVGLHRLSATILATNSASFQTYVKKCGWTEEGRSRDQVWRDGSYVDLIHIGVLRDEFIATPWSQEYIYREQHLDAIK